MRAGADRPCPPDPGDAAPMTRRRLRERREAAASVADAEVADRAGAPRWWRRRFGGRATPTATVTAMGAAAMLAVGMTAPLGAAPAAAGSANPAATSSAATGHAAGRKAKDADDADIQAFVTPSTVQSAELIRPGRYETVSFAEIAAASGIDTAGAFYVNDPTADIQWPLIAGTGMSYGYGMRDGRLHEGIDFTPGDGAPIQAIAAGTVRRATESDGGYGVGVYIDHVIDGQLVTSHYAHMQHGSLAVADGQRVQVGDPVGRVGNTGNSFGAHLHFELLVGDQSFDPLPWLQQNAGRHYTVAEKAAVGAQ